MKKISALSILIFLCLNLAAQENEMSILNSKNAYLGQTPPGDMSVPFAQGIISVGNVHSRLAISPDGREMYWNTVSFSPVLSVKIQCVKYENNKWTEPCVPSFAKNGMTQHPLFSPNGRKLFFSFSEDVKKGFSDKYVEKTDSGWSDVKNSGFLFSTSSSFAKSGIVYFSAPMTGKPWDTGIYTAQYSENGYVNIKPLDAMINSPYIDYTPFVSENDDYLMFSSSRPSRNENMFLYIAFKNNPGTWSEPKKMHEALGFSSNARFPSISPDGKYLFFCGDDRNIYWVSAKVIEKFRPAKELVR